MTNNNEHDNKVAATKHLTEEQTNEPEAGDQETREIVTPYAFTVSADLLGQPLASPTRRGLAIFIDLFLITVLSTISALIFAGFVALTFFRAGKRINKKGINKKGAMHYISLFLRGSAAFIIFLIAFAIVDGLDKHENNEPLPFNIDEKQAMTMIQGIVLSICDDSDIGCFVNAASKIAGEFAESDFPQQEAEEIFDEILQSTELSKDQQKLILDSFNTTYALKRKAYLEKIEETKVEQASKALTVDTTVSNVSEPADKEEKSENSETSLLEWIERIMSELGLGLGWAALYFSVFTAWSNGQTIGKRLLGIKVVRLDGTTPNLWESFGRYGGYGAGLATGLLGFLQLYWDPNRQAIQDKISETLVLRLSPKNK